MNPMICYYNELPEAYSYNVPRLQLFTAWKKAHYNVQQAHLARKKRKDGGVSYIIQCSLAPTRKFSYYTVKFLTEMYRYNFYPPPFNKI